MASPEQASTTKRAAESTTPEAESKRIRLLDMLYKLPNLLESQLQQSLSSPVQASFDPVLLDSTTTTTTNTTTTGSAAAAEALPHRLPFHYLGPNQPEGRPGDLPNSDHVGWLSYIESGLIDNTAYKKSVTPSPQPKPPTPDSRESSSVTLTGSVAGGEGGPCSSSSSSSSTSSSSSSSPCSSSSSSSPCSSSSTATTANDIVGLNHPCYGYGNPYAKDSNLERPPPTWVTHHPLVRCYVSHMLLMGLPPPSHVNTSTEPWRGGSSSSSSSSTNTNNRPRGSPVRLPPLPSESVEQLLVPAVHLLAELGNASTDHDVELFLRDAVLPAANDRVCGPGLVNQGLVRLDIVCRRQVVPNPAAEWHRSDLVYGYPKTAFRRTQLAGLEAAAVSRNEPRSVSHYPVQFPFLAVHFGGPSGPRGGGPHLPCIDICLVAAYDCLEPAGWLHDKVVFDQQHRDHQPRDQHHDDNDNKASSSSSFEFDNRAFVLIAGNDRARLYQICRAARGSFPTQLLQEFALTNIDHVRALRTAVRNIVHWGRTTRLNQLMRMAHQLRRDQIRDAMLLLGLERDYTRFERFRCWNNRKIKSSAAAADNDDLDLRRDELDQLLKSFSQRQDEVDRRRTEIDRRRLRERRPRLLEEEVNSLRREDIRLRLRIADLRMANIDLRFLDIDLRRRDRQVIKNVVVDLYQQRIHLFQAKLDLLRLSESFKGLEQEQARDAIKLLCTAIADGDL